VAVEAERDEVAGAHRCPPVEQLLLRHVPDPGSGLPRRRPEHVGGAGSQAERAENHAEEAALPGAVGPEHGDQLAAPDREIETRPQRP